jgi:hypothetical protein
VSRDFGAGAQCRAGPIGHTEKAGASVLAPHVLLLLLLLLLPQYMVTYEGRHNHAAPGNAFRRAHRVATGHMQRTGELMPLQTCRGVGLGGRVGVGKHDEVGVGGALMAATTHRSGGLALCSSMLLHARKRGVLCPCKPSLLTSFPASGRLSLASLCRQQAAPEQAGLWW